MKTKLIGLLLLLATFSFSAHADTFYNITGSLTIPGNSANPGMFETINFSVDLDYANSGRYSTLVGTPTITAFGPLGSFSVVYVPGDNGELGFGSSMAVLELDSEFFGDRNPNGLTFSDVWSCSSSTICSDFWPGGPPGAITGNALLWGGTANIAVTTPEPAAMWLCALGLLALLVRKRLVRA
jgi:hypothetical protein